MSAISDLSEADLDALVARTQADQLTDADRELLAELWPQISAAAIAAVEALTGLLLPGLSAVTEAFTGIFDSGVMSSAEAFRWFIGNSKPPGPSYRTEPIPGAELGGIPRNPEADVVDEIDRIVDWQLKGGEGW